MRTLTMMAAASAVAIALASPALAVQYRFDVFDQGAATIDNNSYTFYFDNMPFVSIFTPETFSLGGTAFYTMGGSPGQADGTFTFFTSNVFGGLSTPLGSYTGDQLFIGDTSAPTFLLGMFTLDSGTITISAVGGGAGAVPEPASWGLMIAGFGMIGASLRARRQIVRFAE